MTLKRSDDNGVYLQKGCPKRLCAHCENGTYYINRRIGTRYQKIYVDCKEVYELNRIYRQYKQNRAFIQMFATARRVDQKNILSHYFVSYRWNDDVRKNEKRDF